MKISGLRNGKKKRIEKNKQNFRDLRDFIKHTNIGVMDVPEEEEEEKGTETVFEVLKTKTLLNVIKKGNLYIQIAYGLWVE